MEEMHRLRLLRIGCLEHMIIASEHGCSTMLAHIA